MRCRNSCTKLRLQTSHLRAHIPRLGGAQKSAVKQRGREKKGPPDIAPKSFSPKAAKIALCSFHRSHREICTQNWPLSETKFLDDFWGPFPLPAPLFYCWKKLVPKRSALFLAFNLSWANGLHLKLQQFSRGSRGSRDSQDSRKPLDSGQPKKNPTIFWRF